MIGRLRKVITRAKKILMPSSMILIYHRVSENVSDPQLLCVTPQHFSEQLEVLLKRRVPIGLQALARDEKNRNIRRGVAITFDDGYADNLYFARPVLERHAMPATVFITGANIGSTYEYWWDELERILLQPGLLPDQIQLTIAGKLHTWDLGEASDYRQKDFDEYCGWNVLETVDPTKRQSLYRSLCQLLHPLSDHECQRVLEDLRSIAGMSRPGRATQRVMTEAEIRQLAAGGLIEVGAHTMTHPVLSSLPIQLQQKEINDNKQQLQEILGSEVSGFSYPYGSRGDYTLETMKLVQESGFVYACANFPDLTSRQTDLFQLPRIIVRDWDGDEFTRQIEAQLRQ